MTNRVIVNRIKQYYPEYGKYFVEFGCKTKVIYITDIDEFLKLHNIIIDWWNKDLLIKFDMLDEYTPSYVINTADRHYLLTFAINLKHSSITITRTYPNVLDNALVDMHDNKQYRYSVFKTLIERTIDNYEDTVNIDLCLCSVDDFNLKLNTNEI